MRNKNVWLVTLGILLLIGVGIFSFQYENPDSDTADPEQGLQNDNQDETNVEKQKNPIGKEHFSVQHKEYPGEVTPDFSPEELIKPPSGNWLTNGGNIYNGRYSPLNKIDTSNVSDLKAEWITSMGTGHEFKYSGESTPLVYDGVMFNVTGENHVAAIDATTGEFIWEYKPKLPKGLDTLCCGWANRGVALGDGKVFIGLLDARLVALDQKTGEVLWETVVDEWEKGYTITSAPLFYDGKVYTGIAGGEYGIRGYVAAYDADIGRQVWRTYTLPEPGAKGSETWPEDSENWLTGGAPVWQTPAVDPELGLIYFATGNSSPDLDGSNRKGDNLYTDSVMALNADTGEYEWHFQEVHHDIWDYDPANPVVLYDVKMNGETKKGIAQAGKTGWVYLLDRTNGEPLVGIEEKPVPQNKNQKTSPTQPFPIGDSFVPQKITKEDIERDLPKEFDGKFGNIFTPFWDEPVTVKPSPQGGANWPPSAYNPNTELFYVLGNDNYFSYAHYAEDEENKFEVGKEWLGSIWQPVEKSPSRGTVTAIDIKTNKIVWQNDWDTIAYSGILTTAGNLIFTGHNDGRIIAYDATNGEKVWQFKTDAGANAPPITYKVDGKQYISIFSAGNSLAGTQHGDKIYTFSLEGKYESLEDIPEDDVTVSPAKEEMDFNQGKQEDKNEVSVDEGLKVYENNCLSCHGAEGAGGHNGPNLQNINMNTEQIIQQIKNGGGNMPGFEGTLTEEEIKAVTEYIRSLSEEEG
ncbi:alcohol dehydrogenase (cytochrome c) [Virgibacillus subterraneus]|uniref:Alcohol dehydrogenase (Cytochrome c) n=1 Tax=Virgibacillus subterraneus TaxID=621109 RepID=A0A1H9JQ95_9BACI|nr:PQQ-binding-like beta-propeller repeat protein [Virgibacillus subterraneus]SEQ89032.1 alcohol dehydrogenase (cytochrome c) [Virgibacillus subterraneus]